MTAQYPYSLTLPVTFRDLDVMNHINNAVYITWFETVRTYYVAELLEIDSPRTLPIILAEITCRYKAPGAWGETVIIGCGVSRLGTKSFDLAYAVTTTAGRSLALGSSVQVFYDYERQSSALLPDSFRQRVAARQGDWRPPA